MKLEIAEFIFSNYNLHYQHMAETLQEDIDMGYLDPNYDLDEVAQQYAYDQMEVLIYDDLEYNFEFVTHESLSYLISQAEEVLNNDLADIMELELDGDVE